MAIVHGWPGCPNCPSTKLLKTPEGWECAKCGYRHPAPDKPSAGAVAAAVDAAYKEGVEKTVDSTAGRLEEFMLKLQELERERDELRAALEQADVELSAEIETQTACAAYDEGQVAVLTQIRKQIKHALAKQKD